MKRSKMGWFLLMVVASGLGACDSQSRKGGPPAPEMGERPGVGDAEDSPSKQPGSGQARPGTWGSDTLAAAGANDAVALGPLQSCSDLASRACARLAECTPWLVGAYYGDRAECEQVFSGACSALETAGKAVSLERCEVSLTNCSSFVEARGVPAWCWKPAGKAALGQSCVIDMDCDAGLCMRGKGDAAGVCGLPSAAGESCGASQRCATGLRCRAPEGDCVAPVARGKSCESPFDCEAGSKCQAGECAALQVGDACAQGSVPCDIGQGQTCVLDQCVEIALRLGGESCLSGTSECAGRDRCAIKQLKNLDRSASCVRAVSVATACNADTPCIEPLTCRSGACQP